MTAPANWFGTAPGIGAQGGAHTAAALSCVGVCTYLATFWVGGAWDVPLLFLSASAIGAFAVAPPDFPGRAYTRRLAVIALLIRHTALSAYAARGWPGNLSGSEGLLPPLLVYCIIASQFNQATHFRMLARALCVLSLGLSTSVFLGIHFAGGSDTRLWVLAAGSPLLVVPNDIVLVAILSPFCLLELMRRPKGPWSLVALAALVMGLAAIVILRSRTGFATQLAAMVLMAWMHWDRRAWHATFAVIATGLVFDAFLGSELLQKFFGSWGTRPTLWIAAFNMFLDAPLLGHGPHAFAELWRQYLDTVFSARGLPIDPESVPWAHNLILELLAERGLPGAALFVLATWLAVRSARETARGAPTEAARAARAVFASLLCFCLAACLELTLLRLSVLVTWFMLLASAEALRLTVQEQGGRD